jgi:hypothetical protein
MKKIVTPILAITLLNCAAMFAQATVIYSDTFDRTGALDGTVPSPTDQGTDTWAASDWTTAAGTANTADIGAALLPLDVTSGHIYSVSANLTVTSGSWIGLGFAQSETTTDGFNVGNDEGPWILLSPPTGDGLDAVPGPSADNIFSVGTGGQGDLYKVVLNTEATDWVATFYDGTTKVGTYTYGVMGASPNPTADSYVGFGVYAYTGATPASVSNFMVTAESTPEPTTWALLLLGASALIFVLRTRRVS